MQLSLFVIFAASALAWPFGTNPNACKDLAAKTAALAKNIDTFSQVEGSKIHSYGGAHHFDRFSRIVEGVSKSL